MLWDGYRWRIVFGYPCDQHFETLYRTVFMIVGIGVDVYLGTRRVPGRSCSSELNEKLLSRCRLPRENPAYITSKRNALTGYHRPETLPTLLSCLFLCITVNFLLTLFLTVSSTSPQSQNSTISPLNFSAI